MTELLYLTDSYLKEFDAKVIEYQSRKLILDRTAFYPSGGGQPHDLGEIYYTKGKASIIKVYKAKESLIHEIDEDAELKRGDEVKGVIDWELRYLYMRYHTALHILSGIMYHSYRALVTGGQIYKDRARLDFDVQKFDREDLEKVEEEANRIVKEGKAVKIKFLSREEAIKLEDLIRTKVNLIPADVKSLRLVEIEGFDTQADGGTHVKNTKEVGKIKISYFINKGKHNKRIEIVLEP
ncbi:MAG: alanyl-tRNA editing protein AlaXM [Nitrososphaerales archaeon]